MGRGHKVAVRPDEPISQQCNVIGPPEQSGDRFIQRAKGLSPMKFQRNPEVLLWLTLVLVHMHIGGSSIQTASIMIDLIKFERITRLLGAIENVLDAAEQLLNLAGFVSHFDQELARETLTHCVSGTYIITIDLDGGRLVLQFLDRNGQIQCYSIVRNEKRRWVVKRDDIDADKIESALPSAKSLNVQEEDLDDTVCATSVADIHWMIQHYWKEGLTPFNNDGYSSYKCFHNCSREDAIDILRKRSPEEKDNKERTEKFLVCGGAGGKLELIKAKHVGNRRCVVAGDHIFLREVPSVRNGGVNPGGNDAITNPYRTEFEYNGKAEPSLGKVLESIFGEEVEPVERAVENDDQPQYFRISPSELGARSVMKPPKGLEPPFIQCRAKWRGRDVTMRMFHTDKDRETYLRRSKIVPDGFIVIGICEEWGNAVVTEYSDRSLEEDVTRRHLKVHPDGGNHGLDEYTSFNDARTFELGLEMVQELAKVHSRGTYHGSVSVRSFLVTESAIKLDHPWEHDEVEADELMSRQAKDVQDLIKAFCFCVREEAEIDIAAYCCDTVGNHTLGNLLSECLNGPTCPDLKALEEQFLEAVYGWTERVAWTDPNPAELISPHTPTILFLVARGYCDRYSQTFKDIEASNSSIYVLRFCTVNKVELWSKDRSDLVDGLIRESKLKLVCADDEDLEAQAIKMLEKLGWRDRIRLTIIGVNGKPIRRTGPQMTFTPRVTGITGMSSSRSQVIDTEKVNPGKEWNGAQSKAMNPDAQVAMVGVYNGNEVCLAQYQEGRSWGDMKRVVPSIESLSHPSLLRLEGICDNGKQYVIAEPLVPTSFQELLNSFPKFSQPAIDNNVHVSFIEFVGWTLTCVADAMSCLHNARPLWLLYGLNASHVLFGLSEDSDAEHKRVHPKLSSFALRRILTVERMKMLKALEIPEVKRGRRYSVYSDVFCYGKMLEQVVEHTAVTTGRVPKWGNLDARRFYAAIEQIIPPCLDGNDKARLSFHDINARLRETFNGLPKRLGTAEHVYLRAGPALAEMASACESGDEMYEGTDASESSVASGLRRTKQIERKVSFLFFKSLRDLSWWVPVIFSMVHQTCDVYIGLDKLDNPEDKDLMKYILHAYPNVIIVKGFSDVWDLDPSVPRDGGELEKSAFREYVNDLAGTQRLAQNADVRINFPSGFVSRRPGSVPSKVKAVPRNQTKSGSGTVPKGSGSGSGTIPKGSGGFQDGVYEKKGMDDSTDTSRHTPPLYEGTA